VQCSQCASVLLVCVQARAWMYFTVAKDAKLPKVYTNHVHTAGLWPECDCMTVIQNSPNGRVSAT